MSSLHTIVYVSSSKMLFSTFELEDLCSKARLWNQEHSITGALLYNDGQFIQCIEGPWEELNLCYSRILLDQRHSGVTELLNRPITSRVFESWNLGFARIGQDRRPQLIEALAGVSPNATNKTHPSLGLMKSLISAL